MSVKWIDGFEIYETDKPLVRRYATAVITQSNANATTSYTEIGRMGYGKALAFFGTQVVTPQLSVGQNTWVVGFGFNNFITSNTGAFDLLQFINGNSGDVAVAIQFNPSTRLLSVRSRSGGTIGTGTTTLNPMTWYHVQVKLVVNATTGSVEVRLNNVSNPSSEITLINKNTTPLSGTTVDRIAFTKPSVSKPQHYKIDDLYVLDGADSGVSGQPNNDFLGDMKIEAVVPTSDSAVEWTKSSGATNAAAVAQHDSAYVYADTSGGDKTDLYGIASLQQITTGIAAVAVHVYANTTDGTTHPLKGVMEKSSTTVASSETSNINSTSETWSQFIFEADTADAAWTKANVESTHFGMKGLDT